MQVDRNCGMGYPYQPIMMPPMMPFNQNSSSVEQRLNEIEKRLSILESNLGKQNAANSVMSNYQMI